jgi:light-regulated signal transduction histidine kinase (bacteriophytochrome)/CheY-like chemotaxis protein
MSLSPVVLIIDDSETDRETYCRYLMSARNFDCQIVDRESAESALQLCKREYPDIILLDYLLPDADGLEFLRELRELRGSLPIVIMLTGQGNESVAVEAMKYGVKDYLIKGELTRDKLITAVTNALNTQQLQAKIDRQRQQRELLASINLQISQAIELSSILQDAVEGVKKLLGTDRAIVYQFHPDQSGTIVAESVLPQWSASIARQLNDTCFQNTAANKLEQYLRGHKTVVENIETANLTPCHIQMLQEFQVKAVLAIPILFRVPPACEVSLWGLLIAHHCETTHEWRSDEIDLLTELAMQMAIAIQQTELVIDLKATVKQQQAIEQELRDRVLEIEQTNSRLSETSGLLQRRNQELDDFSHIASHDLQAPLRGISNLAQWLVSDLEGQLPKENQHQLELIQSRVVQMTTLINGLLQYALVGRENIAPINVNLSQLIAEVVDLLAPPNNLTVSFSTDLPTIRTQALLLKQVLSNLVGNAIKYHDVVTNTQGRVEILVVDEDTLWRFSVIDDGPGIAPENQQKIFGIFQTLVGRDDMKGMGIGLAVIKKIVESRGGTVAVESTIGQGSTFSFTWPKML